MKADHMIFALLLTLLAGLSTGIGSTMAFFSKKFNPEFLAGALGFSAGVMIYVSLVGIFAKTKDSLVISFRNKTGYWLAVIAFFCGIALIAITDKVTNNIQANIIR